MNYNREQLIDEAHRTQRHIIDTEFQLLELTEIQRRLRNLSNLQTARLSADELDALTELSVDYRRQIESRILDSFEAVEDDFTIPLSDPIQEFAETIEKPFKAPTTLIKTRATQTKKSTKKR